MDVSHEAHSPTSKKVARPRVIASCAYCYARKIKCDKVFPCLQCLRRGRGDSCHSPQVTVKGRVVGGPLEGAPRRQLGPLELQAENAALHRRIAAQERHVDRLQRTLEELQGGAGWGKDAERAPSDAGTESDMEIEDGDSAAGDALETDLLVQEPVESPDEDSGAAESQSHGGCKSELEMFADFVPWTRSDFPVGFHFKYLCWIHCTVHAPTFLDWHAQWIQDRGTQHQKPLNAGSLALYFAVISVRVLALMPSIADQRRHTQSGLFYADVNTSLQNGFSRDEHAALPRLWCELSMRCIDAALRHTPTLSVLQAACVLPMVAHALGYSRRLRLLLHTALLIAQDLRLHELPVEQLSASSSPGRIEREMGRRVWNCLIISECMSPAVLKRHTLLYPKTPSQSVPCNADDQDLSDFRPCIVRPLKEPTIVSHILAMRRLANLLHDYNSSVHLAVTLHSKQSAVLEIDTRLKKLLDFCPSLKPIDDEQFPFDVSLDKPYDYLPWARYTWAWKIASYRMKFHSFFLGSGNQHQRYRESEKICMQCALTLLRHRQRVDVPQMYQRAWRVTLDTIYAGVVFGKLASQAAEPTERAYLLDRIAELCGLLVEADPSDVPAQRGYQFLSTILAAANTSPEPSQSGAVPEIVNNIFMNSNWDWTTWDTGAFESSSVEGSWEGLLPDLTSEWLADPGAAPIQPVMPSLGMVG